ncbi:MAG: prepilin-type N-terminal cleavage/methylation domain-containing protein [Alphaproteobacteria bacterium]|nr:prepilin-type N-terminal cleavage/methylation domain-containing protein [Alphaproteobacteria bacterium]
MKNSHRQGFTLIEMSIVLVIVGLIIGVMLQGQEMIQTARVKATVTQWEKSKVSVTAFKQKFNALPGDYNMARKKIDSELVDGDGDGRISSADDSEYLNVWEHLSRAQMISDVEKYKDSNGTTRSRYAGELQDAEFFIFYGVPNKGTGPHASVETPKTTNVASMELPAYTAKLCEDVMFAADTGACTDSEFADNNPDFCECVEDEAFDDVDSSSTCYVCHPQILNSVVSNYKASNVSNPDGWKTDSNIQTYMGMNTCNVCGQEPRIDGFVDAAGYNYQDYSGIDWFTDQCDKCDFPDVFAGDADFLDYCQICDGGAKLPEFEDFVDKIDNLYETCGLCDYDISVANDEWFKYNCVCGDPSETHTFEDEYASVSLNVYDDVCNFCEPAAIKDSQDDVGNTADLIVECGVCADVDNAAEYYNALGDEFIDRCSVCDNPETYIPKIGKEEFFDKCGVCTTARIESYVADLNDIGIDVYDECICSEDAATLEQYESEVTVDLYDECGVCSITEPNDNYDKYKGLADYEQNCVCPYDDIADYESRYGSVNVYAECGYCIEDEIAAHDVNIGVDLYDKCACDPSTINNYLDANGESVTGAGNVYDKCEVCNKFADYYDIVNGFADKCACDPNDIGNFETKYDDVGENVYDVCGYCGVGEIAGNEATISDVFNKCKVCTPEKIADYDGIIVDSTNEEVYEYCEVCNNPQKYGDELGWDVYNARCSLCENPNIYLASGETAQPGEVTWDVFEATCKPCDKANLADYTNPADVDKYIDDYYEDDRCGKCGYPETYGGGDLQSFLDECVCSPDEIKKFETSVPTSIVPPNPEPIDVYGEQGCNICTIEEAKDYALDEDTQDKFKSYCSACIEEGYPKYYQEDWYDDVCDGACHPDSYKLDQGLFVSHCEPCDKIEEKFDDYYEADWFELECSPCDRANMAEYAQWDTDIYTSTCNVCAPDEIMDYYNTPIINLDGTSDVDVFYVCSVCGNPQDYYEKGVPQSTFIDECGVCDPNNVMGYVGDLDGLDVLDHCKFCVETEYEKYQNVSGYQTTCGFECSADAYKNNVWWWDEMDCSVCDYPLDLADYINEGDCENLCAPENMQEPWFDLHCDTPCVDPQNHVDEYSDIYRDCELCVPKETYYHESYYKPYCEDYCLAGNIAEYYVFDENIYNECGYCDEDKKEDNYEADWYPEACGIDPCDPNHVKDFETYETNIYSRCGLCSTDYEVADWMQPESTWCDYCHFFSNDLEACDACTIDPYGKDDSGSDCNTCAYLPELPMCDTTTVVDPCTVTPGMAGCSTAEDPCDANPNAPACKADYDDNHHFMHLLKWQKSGPAKMGSASYVLTGEQAFEIDRKFDDGDYEKGGIVIVCPAYTAKNGAEGDAEFSPLGKKKLCYTSMRID